MNQERLTSETPPASDAFYSGALDRIRYSMIALALALSIAAWWNFGRASALGFLGGCIIAYLNFHWLKSGVSGLADRVTDTGKPQSGFGIVARFLLRIVTQFQNYYSRERDITTVATVDGSTCASSAQLQIGPLP